MKSLRIVAAAAPASGEEKVPEKKRCQGRIPSYSERIKAESGPGTWPCPPFLVYATPSPLTRAS
jgi:hypothetical protein